MVHRAIGLILSLCPANERQCYLVTTSLIGWTQTKNQSWRYKAIQIYDKTFKNNDFIYLAISCCFLLEKRAFVKVALKPLKSPLPLSVKHVPAADPLKIRLKIYLKQSILIICIHMTSFGYCLWTHIYEISAIWICYYHAIMIILSSYLKKIDFNGFRFD